MPVDTSTLALIIVAVLLGVNIDCNRRVRELQRNSDLQIRWLDAIAAGRRITDSHDPDYPRPPKARDDRRR